MQPSDIATPLIPTECNRDLAKPMRLHRGHSSIAAPTHCRMLSVWSPLSGLDAYRSSVASLRSAPLCVARLDSLPDAVHSVAVERLHVLPHAHTFSNTLDIACSAAPGVLFVQVVAQNGTGQRKGAWCGRKCTASLILLRAVPGLPPDLTAVQVVGCRLTIPPASFAADLSAPCLHTQCNKTHATVDRTVLDQIRETSGKQF